MAALQLQCLQKVAVHAMARQVHVATTVGYAFLSVELFSRSVSLLKDILPPHRLYVAARNADIIVAEQLILV